MNRVDRNSFLFTFLVLFSLLVLYTAYDSSSGTLQFEKLIEVFSFEDMQHSFRELNKIIALAGIGLITFVYLIGSLAKVWPDIFARHLKYRKPLGLIGFWLIIIHAVYSIIDFYQLSLDVILASPKLPAFIAGTLSILIFILSVITSNPQSIQRLGYKNWKNIQRTGYIALLLGLLHFVWVETKPEIGFVVRPYGMLFYYAAILAIVLRVIVIFIDNPKKNKYEEHVSHPKDKKNIFGKMKNKTKKKTRKKGEK